jgi:hypothetical protein
MNDYCPKCGQKINSSAHVCLTERLERSVQGCPTNCKGLVYDKIQKQIAARDKYISYAEYHRNADNMNILELLREIEEVDKEAKG